MVVLELEERSDLCLLVDNYWQYQASVELGRCIEVDLTEESAQACHWLGIPLDLFSKAVDL